MSALPATHTLNVHGVSCKLGNNQVLHELSLPTLHGAQLVALIGPNGSGKSTLLRSIAGLNRAHISTLTLNGSDLGQLPARLRAGQIRYLPQTLAQAIHLTVVEALLVALNARRTMDTREAMIKIQDVLDDLGISDLGPRYLDELSGGQKQLVSLAQYLVHRPSVLLLDEPLASLDLNYQHHVMQLLKRLTASTGLLVVIVLHDLNIAMRYADFVVMLNKGRLAGSGPASSVLTPESLAEAFLVQARVEQCSQGYANILVDDLIRL